MIKKVIPIFVLVIFLFLNFISAVLAECNCYCIGQSQAYGVVSSESICESTCQSFNLKIQSCNPCCCKKIGTNEIKEINFTNNNCVCGSGWSAINVTNCETATSGDSSSSSNRLTDPLNLGGEIDNLWIRIIEALLGFVAIASLVTFVYAGFMFLISTGNAEKVKKAKDTIVYAILGIFLSIASYSILSFIFKILEK